MRKNIFILFFLFSAACHSSADPKETATAFIHAMQNNNFAKAKDYVTGESDPLLGALATSPNENLFPVKQNETFVISEIKNEGEDLLLTVTVNQTKQKMQLLLKKEYGKWKVAYDMDTLMKSAAGDN